MTIPREMTGRELEALADRVAAKRSMDNAIDVLVEIALFEPDDDFASIRANDAGTKVICTCPNGKKTTFWARDWTNGANQRRETARLLRARASAAPVIGGGE